MAFLFFRREEVEKKEPEAPARPNDPAPSPQREDEKKVPDADPRQAQAAHDDGPTIEEPGYGHGV
jgi:hypothetical protein